METDAVCIFSKFGENRKMEEMPLAKGFWWHFVGYYPARISTCKWKSGHPYSYCLSLSWLLNRTQDKWIGSIMYNLTMPVMMSFKLDSGSKCWFQQVNLKKTTRFLPDWNLGNRHGKYVDGDAEGRNGWILLHPNWSRDCWWRFDLTLIWQCWGRKDAIPITRTVRDVSSF